MLPVARAALAVALLACVSSAATTTPAPVDVKSAAKDIAASVHVLVQQAREGLPIDQIFQEVTAIQQDASNLLVLLPQVSECESKSVIKMAAAATGSHEVLSVMVAEDMMSVLNGRLALSFGFLEQVTLMMEDELTLSDDVSGHLAAIVFGAETTANIVDTAGKAVKQLMSGQDGELADHHANRVRRQGGNINLGSGWSVGLGGVNWNSRSGSTSFNVKPTFSGFKPDGFKATLTFRF